MARVSFRCRRYAMQPPRKSTRSPRPLPECSASKWRTGRWHAPGWSLNISQKSGKTCTSYRLWNVSWNCKGDIRPDCLTLCQCYLSILSLEERFIFHEVFIQQLVINRAAKGAENSRWNSRKPSIGTSGVWGNINMINIGWCAVRGIFLLNKMTKETLMQCVEEKERASKYFYNWCCI